MSAPLALADFVAGRAHGPDGHVRLDVDAETWEALAQGCAGGTHDLAALWADNGSMRMALSDGERGPRAIVSLKMQDGAYPSVARHHAPALRLERAMRDLYGTNPLGLPDPRPWLDHGRWPGRENQRAYEFLPVEGEGLHQIPVGPVHASIIEPGHFRFTCQRRTVVRLEERLGYVHKGVEESAHRRRYRTWARLIGRLSGVRIVAYSWAYACGRGALGWQVPPRDPALRGVMAELERMAHTSAMSARSATMPASSPSTPMCCSARTCWRRRARASATG
jgi:hypothetical protein